MTKCQKDTTCGIFLKRGLFKDIKNDIPMCRTHKYKNTKTQIHKYKSVIVVHCGLVGARHARKRRILSEEGRNTSSSGNSFSSNNKLCRCIFNSQILKGFENLDILRPRGQCPCNIVQLYNRYTDTHKSLVCLLYFSGGNSLLAKQ